MTTETARRAAGAPDPSPDLVRLWRGYADRVYGDYPLYRALAGCVAQDPEVLELIQKCRPEAHDPNMLLAAIQYLVLGGAGGDLAAAYAEAGTYPSEPDATGLAAGLNGFCREHRGELTGLMNSRHIQTNETGRCAPLALGLAAAARSVGEPIALIDDGASAGLNLALDEYLIDFGAVGRLGPDASPVQIECEVRGGSVPQPLRLPVIDRRLGIDRAPVDLRDEDAARWMLACVWPGNDRQRRAREAVRMHSGRPSLVRRGDMVADLEPALKEMEPRPTVVVTSWSYSYLPPEARDPFVEVLTEAGRHRPVAWLCCDLLGVVPMFEPEVPPEPSRTTPSVLGLAIFDRGQTDARTLALTHSHGSWLSWLDHG